MTTPAQLISHGADADVALDERLDAIKLRICQTGDVPGASVDRQLELLDEMARFELGRFLLVNRGLNAEWTHRVVTYVPGTIAAGSLEHEVFEKLPATLATRERFGIFRNELQALLRPGCVMASVPCGVMGELLLLDYARHPDVKLIGIDLDGEALAGAAALASQRSLSGHVFFHCEDAWRSGGLGELDVVTSNGLNIYEPDDERVTALYRVFFDMLKPGGWLVSSFLTPPPAISPQSPWNAEAIDQTALALQHLLLVRIVEAKWNAFRTHTQTARQLEEAGFEDIRFIDDRARMFPTVVARKAERR
ncbi:SAM-dependent methyltransferase [Paraburkholderia tagetis]|uniref:Class I SAM-dependent methyltransferase n=1 Tax=Paraburkholderia tagetis TaxID=2913261 RepID=A0A9X2A1N9_9BURK|nr:class I SAM-dependent methyltransferase [Paraburkholderia tagetis]MCG5078785.1 class I SAM-dependent methyltransferase [Paraburkholderia tagetis]